jgi:CRP/FNR family transcriptional regulator, cyclic AMP receptor protein
VGAPAPRDDLDLLLDVCVPVQTAARRPLLRAEDDRALFLLEGTAKASIVTQDGHDVITELIGPGHAAGLLRILGFPQTGEDISSLVPTAGLAIQGRDLCHLLDTRSAIAAACLRTLARHHALVNADRRRFAGTSISQRVARRLLDLAMTWGVDEGNSVRIALPMTQEEIAAWSGASRESVAKVFRSLRGAQIIATGRRTLRILDMPGLHACCETEGPVNLRELFSTL